MINILLADSDENVRAKIRQYASGCEISVDEVRDGISAIKFFRRKEYNLVVLDAFLPELDGVNVCRQLRKVSSVPIIFLTAKSSEHDRLTGFSAGADDYVIKPFFVSELFARINVLLNRNKDVHKRAILNAGGISVDINARTVFVDEKPVSLSPKEYELLVFLMDNPGRALSRSAILRGVWGEDFDGTDRTVDTHIRALRDSLAPYGKYIITVWGIGYKFERR